MGHVCYSTHFNSTYSKIFINVAETQLFLVKMAKNDLSEVIMEVNDLQFQIFLKKSIDTIKIHLVFKFEYSRWSGG